MNENIFEYSYKVQSKDIDALNHVNNVVYLQYVQEVAFRHWTALTVDKKFDEYTWVVGRHEIDYFRPAYLGDILTIKTWVGATKGSISIRHVEIYKDNKITARIKTFWRLIDRKTLKSIAIPPEILEILNPDYALELRYES